MMMNWNIKLLCGLLTIVTAENPPLNNVWNLRYSDPSRTGKRLNIPLHYGDWVPIDKAKALVQDLAKGFTGQTTVEKKDSDAHQLIQDEDIASLDVASDRIDHGEPIYVNTVPKNLYGYPLQRKPSTPVRFQGQPYNRFQYQKTNSRGYRKLSGPQSQKKTFQQSWYNGKSKQPLLNNKKFAVKPFNQPQRHIPLKNNVSQNKQRPAQSSLTTNQVNTYLESLNAIRTIQAPDLTKYGPPVIELGAGTDGEIVLGHPANEDHLSGFVSLDFDSFSSGDSVYKNSEGQKKEKLSLLVAGNNNIHSNDGSGLVSFLNNEGAKADTFVIESGKTAPKGFSKINLPFMDPTKHKGNLPKAFIAPKGIPIPDGYKGKPLPPTPSDKQTSTESVLLIQVPEAEERKTEADKYKPISLFNRRPTTSFLRPKKKLAEKPKTTAKTTTAPKRSNSLRYKLQKKNRPSLTEFYLKNKIKADKLETKTDEPQKKDYYKKPYEKTYLKNKLFKETIKRTYPTTKIESIITTNPTFIETTKEDIFSTQEKSLQETELPTIETSVDFDNTDPISIIYDPFYEPLSTFEQVDRDNETTTNSQSTTYLSSTEVEPTTETTVFSMQSTSSIITDATYSTTTVEVTVTSTTTTSTTTVSTTSTTVTTSTTTPTSTSTTTTSTIQTTTTYKDITTDEEIKDIPTTSSVVISTAKETTQSPSSNVVINHQSKIHRTTEDPLVKLDILRRQKEKLASQTYQDDLLTAEDIDEDNASTTEVPEFNFIRPFRNRLRLKKFKGLTQNDASGTGKFGKRLRSRKRPTFWAKRYNQGQSSVEPTPRSGPGPFRVKPRPFPISSDDKSIANTEDFKRKFRPFSDQLFNSLPQDSENGFAANNRRFGFPRRRSTAAPTQITVDAEVYEVHPKTRLRVTTRKPYTEATTGASSTDSTETEASTDGDYYTYQDDYAFEPTTAQDTEIEEELTTTFYDNENSKEIQSTTNASKQVYVSTTEASQSYDTTAGEIQATTTEESKTEKQEEVTTKEATTYVPAVTTSSTTIEGIIIETTENKDVHETADKHTTHEQPQFESTTKLNEEKPYENSFEAASSTNENIDLGTSDLKNHNIDLDLSNEIADQEFQESQQVDVVVKPDEESDLNGRLSMYQKNIDTTQYGDDEDYNKIHVNPKVNEHGKPVVTEEDPKNPVNLEGYAGWQASAQSLKPYYKINRFEGESPIVSIEEIELTETKDYSESDIIYDLNKDGFDDDDDSKNSFSIPVSVSLNLPDTTTMNYGVTNASIIDTTVTTENVVASSSTTTEEQSTTVEVVSSTEENVSTTSETLTTEEPVKSVTSYSRIYNIINRNRQTSAVPAESSEDTFEEVFLGTTTNIASTKSELEITTTTQIPTHVTSEHVDETTTEPHHAGAHKIPTKLWDAYKESLDESPLEKVDTLEIDNAETVTEDIALEQSEKLDEPKSESLNIPTPIHYVDVSKEGLIKSTANPQIIEYHGLSQTLEPERETLFTNNVSVNKRPKSYVLTEPTEQSVDKGNIQVHTFGVEQLIPLRTPDGKYKKKSETKSKKREEWIKNWVARKYNKPKFPRGSLSPLTPNKQVITTEEPESQPSIQSEVKNSLFTPTVAPKQPSIDLVNNDQANFERLTFGIETPVRESSVQKAKTTPASNLKSSFLEKYSSTRQNLVKNSRFITNNNKSSEDVKKNKVYKTGVPRGAKANVFKNYAGDKLSQADFERQILGVSTATEISVKSMICVKGRCFNADDMGKLLSK